MSKFVTEYHYDMSDDPHLPSSGAFYNELEALKASRRRVEIIFRSGNGARTVIRDLIAAISDGMDSQSGAKGQGTIRTGSGLDIPLDKVEQVDGIIRSKFT